MNPPPYSEHVKHWQLNSNLVFLNHGSFGATPKIVLQKQSEYRTQMELDPVRFMIDDLENLLWNSKEQLALLVGAKAKDLVFVNNATTGVNTVLFNLKIKQGDEFLTHNHAYGACKNALVHYAEKHGINVQVAEVPFPLNSEDEIIEAFVKKINNKTRFALIDHITSATGLIFPVKKLTGILQEKGIEVLIDGAHAPGMIDLNLEDIGAEYYTGNCHKWVCSPKGSAMLHVRSDKQANFHPVFTSHTYDKPVGEKRWSSQFIWAGTSDFTPYISIGDAIQFGGSLMNDWQTLRAHNHDLTIKGRNILLKVLDVPAPVPDHMLGSLSTIPLPFAYEQPSHFFHNTHPFGKTLYDQFKIQIPIHAWPENNTRMWIRISAQTYNSIEQYEYLGEALKTLLKL